MTSEDEHAWQELAEMVGIPERDRLPSSFEVERERLRRVIVDGQLAQVRLDKARERDLAADGDVIYVNYSADPRAGFEL